MEKGLDLWKEVKQGLRRMTAKKSREQVKLWSLPHLKDAELLHGSYVTQSFAKHAHDGFAIGVIKKGALKFFYRGEHLVASPGCINLAVPGEAHNGWAASPAGWTYRMFYLPPALLEQAVSQMAGRPKGLPFFQPGVIQDPLLAGLIQELHFLLEDPCTPLLEQESRLLWMLTLLIARHADERFPLPGIGKERQAIGRAREHIETCYAEDLSLQRLAAVAHLSSFHFMRIFHHQVGMPPHAYLIQIRVKRAKDLLKKGLPIARVAFETGFADQSHLTRQFKRIVGVTPGQYSKIIQDR